MMLNWDYHYSEYYSNKNVDVETTGFFLLLFFNECAKRNLYLKAMRT